jgi:pimeloyl-ACP methyl ester carboxylesterase
MLNAKVSGDGLTVVFLHGFGEDLTLWDDLTQNISNEFRTIAIDLPGFGKSPAIPAPFTLDQVAAHIYDYLIEEQNVSSFVVIGHSLGGYISLALANNYKENVIGFSLVNSTSLADNEAKKESRTKTSAFINKHGAQFFLNSFVPNLFAPKNVEILGPKVHLVKGMGKNLDNLVLTSYMEAMKNRPSRLELLHEFNHVLFVAGEEDPQFSSDDYKIQIAKLRDNIYGVVLPDVGHMSMYEAPKTLLSTIKRFLKSINNDRN